MPDARRRSSAAVGAMLSLALVACADEDPPPAATATAPAQADLRITRPLDGDALDGTHDEPTDRLTARVEVHGTAEPGEEVQVRGPCAEPACRAIVEVGSSGEWRARVQVAAPAEGGGAAVVAQYAEQDAFDSDRVTVVLRGPGSSDDGAATATTARRSAPG